MSKSRQLLSLLENKLPKKIVDLLNSDKFVQGLNVVGQDIYDELNRHVGYWHVTVNVSSMTPTGVQHGSADVPFSIEYPTFDNLHGLDKSKLEDGKYYVYYTEVDVGEIIPVTLEDYEEAMRIQAQKMIELEELSVLLHKEAKDAGLVSQKFDDYTRWENENQDRICIVYTHGEDKIVVLFTNESTHEIPLTKENITLAVEYSIRPNEKLEKRIRVAELERNSK